MTGLSRRRLAASLARNCARLLPPHRAEWARAMMHEAAAIDDPGEALRFALGCIRASLMERITTMDFAVTTVRWAALAAMLILALFGALGVWRFAALDPPTAILFSLSTSAFVAAGLWSLVGKPTAIVQISSMMLLAYALVLAVMSPSAAASWPNADLHRALALEGMVIWGLLLAAGAFVARYSARSATNRG